MAGTDLHPQRWSADSYSEKARFVAGHASAVLAMLDPKPGERILDLGCGDGALMSAIAESGAVVTGIDASTDLVAAARAQGLDAHVGDAQALDFEARFDAVFSNAALHWMLDADAVAHGVFRALKPGGRFVAEMGAAGNLARIRAAMAAALERRGMDLARLSPKYFPAPQEHRTRLEKAGFRVLSISMHERATPLPAGIQGWLDVFARSVLDALPGAEQRAFRAEVEAELAPQLQQTDGTWQADYVRLRFHAETP